MSTVLDIPAHMLNTVEDFIDSGRRLAVACLGNELRGDDIVGKIVCERLSESCDGKIYIVYAGPDAASIIGLALEGYNVLVVDAVIRRRGRIGDIGDIIIATAEELSEDENLLPSTHLLPVNKLARYLGPRLLIVGVNVNPHNLGLGDKASKEVVRAARALSDLLARVLQC
ncbi:MAG TPA: hydrogenase maturation protease [Pyrodictium sp.]|nr:hydrogenase maturation protease [Pyrodictium sp.]